jgi:hypothetical protein
MQFGEAQIPEIFCGKSVKQQLGCDLVHADGWDFRFGTRGSYFCMILVMGVLLLSLHEIYIPSKKDLTRRTGELTVVRIQ